MIDKLVSQRDACVIFRFGAVFVTYKSVLA